MFTITPTVCFKFAGRVFSVTKIDEGANKVHGALTKAGRRLRGRPRHFNMNEVTNLHMRPIHRSTSELNKCQKLNSIGFTDKGIKYEVISYR